MTELEPALRDHHVRKFVAIFAALVAGISLLPSIYALLVTQPGSHYLGYQYGVDDQMVYAAWMRQAMDGHFLFDNRFAIDPQPGLTINVYFFVLGLIAKALTIPVTTALARAGFGALFVVLVARLMRQVCRDVYSAKLGITLTVLGAGVGYLVWHMFGQAIVKPEAQLFSGLMAGRLPTDVWQPEGYVLPSILTNSLFVASLCLIVYLFSCVLEARNSWKPVPGGMLAMAALMNVHSYDALMAALVLLGFLAATATRKQATAAWALRALTIGAGAIPPALWFLRVYHLDPVFQARAATPTYAPAFRQVVFGYLPMIALGFVAFLKWRSRPSEEISLRRKIGAGLMGVLIAGLLIVDAGSSHDGYLLPLYGWAALMIFAIGAVCLLAEDEPAWNLIVAWAIVGLFAPYFPALFQRKLAMGLAVPWAILAAAGLGATVRKFDRGSRNLATILGFLVVCGSSMLWVLRETYLAENNVSNTTRNSVYLSTDAQRIVNYLQSHSSDHTVVLAMPGQPNQVVDENGRLVPDEFNTPYIPDLNQVLSGVDGVYTYAGHWSETPDYDDRHDAAVRFFEANRPQEERTALLSQVKPDFIVAPIPEAFPLIPLADLSSLGETVVSGTQFQLIKVDPSLK